jgi:hypothetical protein
VQEEVDKKGGKMAVANLPPMAGKISFWGNIIFSNDRFTVTASPALPLFRPSPPSFSTLAGC